MRLLGPEGADAGEAELEARPLHPVEGGDELVGEAALDIADEAQRDVIVLDVDPPCRGQAAAQEGQGEGRVARDLDGCEQSRHQTTSP